MRFVYLGSRFTLHVGPTGRPLPTPSLTFASAFRRSPPQRVLTLAAPGRAHADWRQAVIETGNPLLAPMAPVRYCVNPPLPPTEPRHFPLHGLRRAYISAVVAWYRLRDGGLA